jgi:bisphosphoglycerate-independent phosphoglycerate mutase (AlkP superfamily)
LLEIAKEVGVPHVYVHFFGDGRDTAPRSAAGYAAKLQEFIQKVGIGEVATIVGRYYAMDRDKRWDRIKTAVEGLIHGKGEIAEGSDYVKAIEKKYEKDETDEFLKPIIVNGDPGRIKGAHPDSCPLYLLMDRQMAILYSCSTIALTACEKSVLYLADWTNLSRWTYQKIS